MKKTICALATIIAWQTTTATEQQAWSLDSCINYAVQHNISLKIREANVQSAEQSIIDAKSRYLPNVSAGAGQSWNLGRGLTAENTYANRNTSSFNYSASFSLPLFTGLSTERQIAYAKANLMQITEQFEAAKEDISINVTTGYLQALYTKELHALALQQLSLSEHELERQEALLEAGKIPEVTMLEAKAQVATDQLNVTNSFNDMVMARLDLAQLLRLEGDLAEFDVQPLTDTESFIASPDDVYTKALQYNHSINAARRGIEASEKNISLAKSGYLPTLSFSAGLGSSYYRLSGIPNDAFGKQMRNNYSTYFGLSLNVPIFDAFSTRNSVRRAKMQKFTAELELDQAEEQLYRTIRQAYYQAVGAQEKLNSSKVAEEAAQTSFAAMQEKYNIGRATPTEYEQAKTKALRATSERIQANYELILRTRLLAFYATPH